MLPIKRCDAPKQRATLFCFFLNEAAFHKLCVCDFYRLLLYNRQHDSVSRLSAEFLRYVETIQLKLSSARNYFHWRSIPFSKMVLDPHSLSLLQVLKTTINYWKYERPSTNCIVTNVFQENLLATANCTYQCLATPHRLHKLSSPGSSWIASWRIRVRTAVCHRELPKQQCQTVVGPGNETKKKIYIDIMRI